VQPNTSTSQSEPGPVFAPPCFCSQSGPDPVFYEPLSLALYMLHPVLATSSALILCIVSL
jgi:hypothetical protein